ncbi:ankyrin repeat domain-containing protein [bacterium]|nr:ankyrin repeat domain-containing protein [bacterium]
MDQIFTYEQASRGEIDFVKRIIRRNPAKYGTAGGILVKYPTNSANFALLVYDFEKSNVIFSITQEHVGAPQGTVALCEMAAQNNVAVLGFLLDKGMDQNSRNEGGVTPLAIAITRGQVEAVKLLLRRGANPNLVYFDTFASLQQAVEQYLLGQDQRIPAMISTYKEIIEALLASGADIAQAKRLSSRAGTDNVSKYLGRLKKSGTPPSSSESERKSWWAFWR